MSLPATDGDNEMTVKDNLLQVYKHTGKKFGVLKDQPDKPVEIEYLFQFFKEMRTDTFLLPRDVIAWEQMRNYKLEKWEVDSLLSIDWMYWSILYGRRNRTPTDTG